jgi:hypothetical protein
MAESPTKNAPQIAPLPRQRKLGRAATFAEGAQLDPLRRRSSILSDISESGYSFKSSNDNLPRSVKDEMNVLTASDEPSLWHSAPLAFAILPAVGGLLFNNGSAVVTDILLLALGSMFLNWCVRAPWDWYHAAQKIRYAVQETDNPSNTTIIEEDEEGTVEHNPESSMPDSPTEDEEKFVTPIQKDAEAELARNEVWALLGCFIGPFIGAYLLHTVRSQLSRPSEGLVSNYNLTIFTMAAELRPVAHLIKMKQARVLHLQRVVRPGFDIDDKLSTSEVQELSRRLAELESRTAEPVDRTDGKTMEFNTAIQQSLQSQLDALNRAVRRYEKRQAAQTIQIEARFADLEMRLKDALSLAAAAARTGQQPGLLFMCLNWVTSLTTYWIHTSWAVVMYPFRLTAAAGNGVKSMFGATETQTWKRAQGNTGSHRSSTPRMQSRSSR